MNENNELAITLKNNLLRKLLSDFDNDIYYRNEDTQNVYKLIGEKMMYNEHLCSLTLKFQCGNILKINKLLFPFFDCFTCGNLQDVQEHECFYNYKYFKFIIEYFFTGQHSLKYMDTHNIDCITLLLEINKIGFHCKFANLTESLFTHLLNNTICCFKNLLQVDGGDEFIRKIGIIISIIPVPKSETMIDKIASFFDSHMTNFCVETLFVTDFFVNNLCTTSWGSSLVIKHKYTKLFHKIISIPTFFRLCESVISMGENPFMVFKEFIMANPKCLNNNSVIPMIQQDIFETPSLIDNLNTDHKITLAIKYKNYDYLNKMLISDFISRSNLDTLASFYMQFDTINYQKWEYISSKKWLTQTPVYHGKIMDISKAYSFIFIHSLNLSTMNNIVGFNKIGYVDTVVKNDNGANVGIVINLNMNTKRKILNGMKVFIGNKYGTTSHSELFTIKQLYTCPSYGLTDAKYHANYLDNHRSHGYIYFDENDIARMGMDHITRKTCVFLEKII